MKKLDIQLFLLDNIIWVIVAVYFMVNYVFTPSFASGQNIINIFSNSAPMALLILGQGLVLIVGKFDLSNESILAFAPGVAMLMATQWIPGGLNPFVAIVLTLVIGALCGWLNGYAIGKIKVEPFLTTTSTMIILRGLVLFLVPFAIFNLPPVYTFAGNAKAFGNIPVSVFLVLAIYAFFQIIMQYTRFGRCFMATGGNTRASFIAGINTERIIIYAFVLCGVLSAVAGLIVAGRQAAVTNTMGKDMMLLSFAGAILGGCSLDWRQRNAGGHVRRGDAPGDVLQFFEPFGCYSYFGLCDQRRIDLSGDPPRPL